MNNIFVVHMNDYMYMCGGHTCENVPHTNNYDVCYSARKVNIVNL